MNVGGAILLAAYLAVGLSLAYPLASNAFTGKHDTEPRRPTQVPTGSLGWAVVIFINVTCLWPMYLCIALVGWALDSFPGSGRRLGERVFGKVER